MTKQIRWTVVLLFILALALVACGGGGEVEETAVPQATAVSETESQSEPAQEEAEPTNTPLPEPTDTPEPTNTPEPTSTPLPEATATTVPTDTPEADTEETIVEAPELDLANLEEGLTQFDSYRLQIMLSVTSTDDQNNETTAFIQIEMANITDPPAASVSMTAEGVEDFEEFGSLSMAQVDGVSYMTLPGLGCITSTEEGDLMDSFGSDFLDTANVTDDLDEARFIGEDVINGIEVLHYQVDSSMLDEEDDVEDIAGDIYIAKDGGYLVSMTIDGTGPMDFFGTGEDTYGSMHIEYHLTDINQVSEIAIPEECNESAAGGSEFPIAEDAYELSSFAGFTSYKSDLALSEIIEFYETVLAEEGWTKVEDDSFVLSDTAVLAYTRDAETLNITIGPDDDDTLFVLIVGE